VECSGNDDIFIEGPSLEITEYQKMYRYEDSYWWWVGRRSILSGFLKNSGDSNIRILDAGCGTGANLGYLSAYGNTIGLDSQQIALEYCRKRGHQNIVQADAQGLPFKEKMFDMITALDLLEHVDDRKTLFEFSRVLKADGCLLLTVPAFIFLWSPHDEAMHHKRRYNRRQLKDILESSGFVVERMSYWNFFLFGPVAAMRLVKRRRKPGNMESDITALPVVVNSLLLAVLKLESSVIRYLDFPFGVSLVCRAKKLQ
jgi:SAM-dependent methyltransferase